jgi:hypothetical protein
MLYRYIKVKNLMCMSLNLIAELCRDRVLHRVWRSYSLQDSGGDWQRKLWCCMHTGILSLGYRQSLNNVATALVASIIRNLCPLMGFHRTLEIIQLATHQAHDFYPFENYEGYLEVHS